MTNQINPETVAADAINKAMNKALDAHVVARKTAEAPGIVKRTSAYFADPKMIVRRPGFNVRFDFGEIAELAANIKEQGILMPLQVQRVGDDMTLIDGDRRLTAIEQILKTEPDYFKADGVPIIFVDKKLNDVELTLRMLSTDMRKAYLPMEEATAYKRLRDGGMTLKQICKASGREHMHVVTTMALLDADATVQEAVKDGSVGSTMAKKIAVAARGDKTKQKALIASAKAAGKNPTARRAVKAAVEQARQDSAARRGRVLKIRALTDDQLSAIGAKMAEVLTAKMALLGLAADSDMSAWVRSADLDVKTAMAFGVLEGLKAAAGVQVELIID